MIQNLVEEAKSSADRQIGKAIRDLNGKFSESLDERANDTVATLSRQIDTKIVTALQKSSADLESRLNDTVK